MRGRHDDMPRNTPTAVHPEVAAHDMYDAAFHPAAARRGVAVAPLPSGAVFRQRRGPKLTHITYDREHAGQWWGGMFLNGPQKRTAEQEDVLHALALAAARAATLNAPTSRNINYWVGDLITDIVCPRGHELDLYQAIGGIELSMFDIAISYACNYLGRQDVTDRVVEVGKRYSPGELFPTDPVFPWQTRTGIH
jgi:hypothetical protein